MEMNRGWPMRVKLSSIFVDRLVFLATLCFSSFLPCQSISATNSKGREEFLVKTFDILWLTLQVWPQSLSKKMRKVPRCHFNGDQTRLDNCRKMLSTRAPRRLLLAAAGPIKMSDLVYLRAAASHGSASAVVTSGWFATLWPQVGSKWGDFAAVSCRAGSHVLSDPVGDSTTSRALLPAEVAIYTETISAVIPRCFRFV